MLEKTSLKIENTLFFSNFIWHSLIILLRYQSWIHAFASTMWHDAFHISLAFNLLRGSSVSKFFSIICISQHLQVTAHLGANKYITPHLATLLNWIYLNVMKYNVRFKEIQTDMNSIFYSTFYAAYFVWNLNLVFLQASSI